MRERVLQLYIKNKSDIFFSMEYHVYWWLKCCCFEFSGDKKPCIFEPKSWWKYHIYWLLKRSCFDLFRNGKYGLFWAKKLIERWYLLVTGKFLFRTFWWWEIWSFFSAKKLIKKWYLLGLFGLSMIFQDLGNMVFRAVLFHQNHASYI